MVDVCAISPFADTSRGPWMEMPDDPSEAVDNDPGAAEVVGDEVAGLICRRRGGMLFANNPASCRGDAFQECVFLQCSEAE